VEKYDNPIQVHALREDTLIMPTPGPKAKHTHDTVVAILGSKTATKVMCY
jgi:hypothetical protein